MHRNLNSQFKNTLCEKRSRQANAQLKAKGGGGGWGTLIKKEMPVSL